MGGKRSLQQWFLLVLAFVLASGAIIGCDTKREDGKTGDHKKHHKDGVAKGENSSNGDDQAEPSDEDRSLKRIILLNNGADPYWDAMKAGMLDAERDLNLRRGGLRVVMDQNDATVKGQIDKLRQYANQTDIAGVAVSVIDAANESIAQAMTNLRESGVQVIAVDSDVDRKKHRGSRFAYLGTNNFRGGEELGKAGKALQPSGGEYATFVGIKGAANAIDRIKGFKAGAGPDFTQVESLGDKFDKAVAEKNVKDALDQHPELKVLVGIYAYNAHAIASAVRSRKVRDKVSVVVFDAAPQAIEDMADGYIDAMILQNPYQMGYDGVRMMKALIDDDQATLEKMFPAWDASKKQFSEPDGDVIETGLRVVYPDDGSTLDKSIFAEQTEFLKLKDFRAWLKKYKLKGS